MQLQSLFSSKEEKKKDKKLVELDINLLTEEITNYLEQIRKIGLWFEFEEDENKFKYTEDLKLVILGFSIFITIVNFSVVKYLPDFFWLNYVILNIFSCFGIYKCIDQEKGIFKNKLRNIKNKRKILNDLLKDDKFKVSLIVNIEKYFDNLEKKFQSNEIITTVKRQRTSIVKEIKGILIEEKLNNLGRLLELLQDMKKMEEQSEILMKEIEEQTKKSCKLEMLENEVKNQLGKKSETEEVEYIKDINKKIKSTL